jgi:hypothetical protein
MGLRKANNPQLNDDGEATAKITKVQFGQGTSKGADGDLETYDRLEISLEMNGTVAPIKTVVFTGVTLNEPTKGKKGELTYNRLTRLALALGLVEKGELKDLNDDTIKRVEDGLQALEGRLVSFKLGMQAGRNLPVPILESFDTVEIAS